MQIVGISRSLQCPLLVLLILAFPANAVSFTESENFRHKAPLGTDAGNPANLSNGATGRVRQDCMVDVPGKPGLPAPFVCKEVVAQTPSPTPVPVPPPARVPVGIVWQTAFDCPDWRQSDYFLKHFGTWPCPGTGIGPHGGWGLGAFEDRIIPEANRPGSVGKGLRHYRGDGQNSGGGGIAITLPGTYQELWGRFWMRYQQGFAWVGGAPHYTKEMYVNVGSPQGWVFGIQGAASWGIFNGKTSIPSSKTWAATMGGHVGDGQWHCYEWHIRHGRRARIEIWVDGAQVLNTTTDMPPGGTTYLALGENQNAVTGAGSTPWYTDYDDLAFSDTGRIGC